MTEENGYFVSFTEDKDTAQAWFRSSPDFEGHQFTLGYWKEFHANPRWSADTAPDDWAEHHARIDALISKAAEHHLQQLRQQQARTCSPPSWLRASSRGSHARYRVALPSSPAVGPGCGCVGAGAAGAGAAAAGAGLGAGAGAAAGKNPDDTAAGVYVGVPRNTSCRLTTVPNTVAVAAVVSVGDYACPLSLAGSMPMFPACVAVHRCRPGSSVGVCS